MDVSIRQATANDFEALCELLEDVEALHREALPHVFRKPEGRGWIQEAVAAATTGDDAVIFVAESAGRAVGLVHASIGYAPDLPIMVPRRYVMIHDLVVGKDFRRVGIGRALVERVHEWALARDVAEVELNVWEFNRPALALYKEMGYETVRRRMSKRLK
ncbi:MAG: GNAT family N-acetyltransferase [Firmicutes bacterium]|nr:GNAT family N-acetyltransferase [Bacillota bacterium]